MTHLSPGRRTISPYEACQDLFRRYPLAARIVDRMGTIYSIVLLLQEGDDVSFFMLSWNRDHGVFSLGPWPAGEVVDIDADDSAPLPRFPGRALTDGIPLPRHGSMFGWIDGDSITSLIVIYAKYEVAMPLPRWTVMPDASLPRTQWPPFIGQRLFGHWFWEHLRDGSVVLLDHLVSGTPDTVFWVNTRAILGSDCCAVARDIPGPAGYTLRRGRYVYSEALRTAEPVPSLTELLADPCKTDLAARFRRSAPIGAVRGIARSA
jgi:hypothetical protein